MSLVGFLARAAFRLAALIALIVAIVSTASAQDADVQDAGARLGGLRVDVRPMIAMGAGAQAEALRADLTAALRRSFAGRLGAGGGPDLVVSVRALSLNAYAGAVGGRGGYGGGLQNDYLDGEALLVGRGGAVLARHPQLSALPASSGGAWYDPASERRRIAAIAEHWAQWLSRVPLDQSGTRLNKPARHLSEVDFRIAKQSIGNRASRSPLGRSVAPAGAPAR